MGCDIHAYIEYIHTYRENSHVYLWAKPEINRSYWLFSLLAKVRGGSLTDELGFEPKGIPEKLSWDTEQDYYYYVDDKLAAEDYDGERFITKAEAENYINKEGYIPERVREDGYVFKAMVPQGDWHTPSWLTLNELEEVVHKWESIDHTITTNDYSAVLISEGDTEESIRKRLEERHSNDTQVDFLGIQGKYGHYRFTYQTERPNVSKDLLACIGAMKALEDENTKTRLTFWFDN